MAVRTFREATVAGLHVTEWSGSDPVVLGLAGLGSTGRTWGWLAEQAPEARVVAPDLRGRGGSVSPSGAGGLDGHADDVAQVVEALDLRDVVIVGHSMGAFLAPLAARRLGERVRRVVLLDGGLPPKLPLPLRHPALVRLAFTANVRRLARPWKRPEDFVKKAAGKAIRDRPDLEPFFVRLADYDLDGPPSARRPRLDNERVVADAVDSFFGAGAGAGDVIGGLDVPVHLLWCPSGKHDGARPMYTADVVEAWTSRIPHLTAERVEANHVTLLFEPRVLQAVHA